MILTLDNIQMAMSAKRINEMDDKTVKASSEGLFRDLYLLAGLEPPLYYDQLDELAHDLRASFSHLTFDELKLAGKAGIAGELGDIRRPSYASIMRWAEAYHKSAMVADARKIAAKKPVERPRITEEQGLAIMRRLMPENARRRWESVRTTGSFDKADIPHVSAQIYDWLRETGVLHLSKADKEAAVAKAKKDTNTRSAWDVSRLEGGDRLIRSRAKHFALQTWMRNQITTGQSLTLPTIDKIYE